MYEDEGSPPPPATLLRRLRALSMAGDEATALRLVRSLCLPDAIALLNAVGMHRWDEDVKDVVDRTARQWRELPAAMRALSRRLSIKVHGAILERVSPRQFAEPRPPLPAKARKSEEAVRIMEKRRRRHQGLRAPKEMDDFELMDRVKKFVGTIFDCEPDARKQYRARVHRTHLDGWNNVSHEAG